MQKVVFFFPWREVSGGPFFLCRLANELARTGLYEVYYTDYQRGLCESLLEYREIKVLKFHDEEHFPIFPEEPVIVIMAEYWAHVVPKLHPQSRIVFFNWHNECVPVLQRDWCATDSFIDRFLQLVYDTSSVFFCDKVHWMTHNTQNNRNLVFKEEYVPITIPPRTKVANQKIIQPNVRNIAILGRLCLDKIYAVLDLVDNIVSLRDFVPTNIYVIGEGDCEHLLFDQKYPKSIKIIRCGTLDIQKVITLLTRKVDILFAMGTSVLDGASIHLPSVVMPNDVKPFECNKYPYLYESDGSLGWYPTQIEELGLTTHTVEEIFADIYQNNQKKEIGENCYRYYLDNHSKNIDKFISAIRESTLTYEKLQNFIRENINWKKAKWLVLHRIRTLHGTTKKRLSLLGFPIFTLTQTNSIHYNIYVCCIPVLRINRINETTTLHILPLVWLGRTIQKVVSLLVRPFKKAHSLEAENLK